MTQVLSFQAVDNRGTGVYTFAAFVGLASVLGGFVLFLVSTRWMAAFVAALGVLVLIWSLRALPQTKYYPYLVLNDAGIQYKDSPFAQELVIGWTRILSAKRLEPLKDEAIGVELSVLSTTVYPTIHRLTMQYAHEVDQALMVICTRINLRSSDSCIYTDAQTSPRAGDAAG